VGDYKVARYRGRSTKRTRERNENLKQVSVPGSRSYLDSSIDLSKKLGLREKSSRGFEVEGEERDEFGSRRVEVTEDEESRLTVIPRHHDFDELDDLPFLELGVLK